MNAIMDLDKKLPDIVKKYPDAIIKKIGFNEDNRLYEQCIHASNLIKDINLVKLINQDVNTKVTIDLHAFSPLCFTYFDINFEIDPIHAKLLYEDPKSWEQLAFNSQILIKNEARSLAVLITEYMLPYFDYNIEEIENGEMESADLNQKLEFIYEKTAMRKFCTSEAGTNFDVNLSSSNHRTIIEDYDNNIDITQNIWESITLDNNIYMDEQKKFLVCKNQDNYERLFKHDVTYNAKVMLLEFTRSYCVTFLDTIRKHGLSIRKNIINNNQNPFYWKEVKEKIEILDLNFLEFHTQTIRLFYNEDEDCLSTATAKYRDGNNILISDAINKTEKYLDQVKYAINNLSTPGHTHDEGILQSETEKVNDRILMLSFIAMAISAIAMMRSSEIDIIFKIISGLSIISLPIIYYFIRSFQKKLSFRKNRKNERTRKLNNKIKSLEQSKKQLEGIDLHQEIPEDFKKEIKEFWSKLITSQERSIKKIEENKYNL